MAHTDSVSGPPPGFSNSDRQLPPAIEAVMQRWARNFRDPDANPDADSATAGAARETLRWFNSRLVELEPGPIDELLAVDLTVRRDWALHALINRYGGIKGLAKRDHLEVTHNHALAICTGGRSRKPVRTVLGEGWASTKGCYTIFEEKTNIAGKKWPPLCPDCQPAAGHRNPYRTAERVLRARAKQIADIRSTS